LALSGLVHWGYIIPKVLAPLVDKPEAPLEIVVAPDPAAPEEAKLPEEKQKPITDEPAPIEAKKEKQQKELPAPEPAMVPPPEVAKVEPPKPKPEVQPPKPVEMPKQRMQMVDQNKFEDEADNQDAHFLAQKNHRAAEDTRSRETNLIREVESKNDKMSEQSDNKADQPGAKNDKIAELENRAGPDKTMPRSAPRVGDEGTSTEHQKPGPLSMRDLTPKSAVKAVDGQKAREGVEQQEQGAGELPMARIGRDSVRGHAAQKGGQPLDHALDHHMYDDIEGYATAEKERNQAARAESSHKKGRYDKYLAKVQAMRSSIENFTLAVKPGNQAELGTRAHPFAGYITSMHRQIHKLFAFGFLTDLEQRMGKGKSVYDDMTLWTKLEIVLNPDGTVDKVGIVRPSGVQGFDVAAIDSVMSAAPFEVPPKVIRSADGKVYLHWQFHRDEMACITSGVDPFILTTPGDKPRDLDGAATNDKSLWQQARESTGREPPRSLKRDPHEEEAQVVRPTQPAPPNVPEVTEEARTAAKEWFNAYRTGNVKWLAGWSALPFTAGGEIVARDADKLKKIYQQLVSEAPSARPLAGFEVLTPAGIRGKLGGLPPGGEESNMLFAVGKAGSEEFILLLKQSDQSSANGGRWRVCGVDR
jgi:TonB family protein